MTTLNKTAKSFEMIMKRKTTIWPLLAVLAGGFSAGCLDMNGTGDEDSESFEKVGTTSSALTNGTIYRIRNVHSNKVLDVSGVSTANGANIHQWDWVGGDNQKWKFIDVGGGRWRIEAVHSLKNIDANDGCGVKFFQDSNYGGAASDCVPQGDYAGLPAANAGNDWASSLQVTGNKRALLFWDPNFGGASLFRNGNDSFLDGGNWNDKMSSFKVFSNVEQYQDNGQDNQRWYADDLGGGQFRLRNARHTNQCLDVEGWSTGNGGNVSMWACGANQNNQKWYIEAISGGGGGISWSDAWGSGGIPTQNFDGIDWNTFTTGDGTFSECACRFVPSQVGTYGGYLWLKAEYGFVAGGWSAHENANVGDRWCKSGELRTRNKYGPYGKISARMKSPNRAGSNPGGKVGFIHSLFTFRTRKSEKWNEIDFEFTGLKPQLIDTNVITTPWNSGCMDYGCTANSQSSVWKDSGYWSTGQWHDYTIDWRSQSISWYVDGQHIRTVNRSQFPGEWPDQPTEIMMNYWLPQHSIEANFGGRWTDADIYSSVPGDQREGQYDWFRFEKCTGGC
jgi:hypothetical protein